MIKKKKKGITSNRVLLTVVLYTISLVQEHHLPERSWVTIKEHSYKTISFFSLKSATYYIYHLKKNIKKQKTKRWHIH